MSAPVTERTRQAARGTATRAAATRTAPPREAMIPAQRGAPAATPRRADTGMDAARKAYARRDGRVRRLVGGGKRASTAPAGRAQFVTMVMVLLAVGLVATLWLSTAASADSYRLQDARTEARTLNEQSERLHREVAAMESAPELARRAAELGMVPVLDSARIVVAPDGTVTVVGEPRAATAPAPPAPPVATPPVPPAPADAATQDAAAQDAASQDAATQDAATQDAAAQDAAAQDPAVPPVPPVPAEAATQTPADPAAANPAVTDPAATDRAVTDPTVTDPAATDRAVTDRAVTDRAATDPAGAAPVGGAGRPAAAGTG